MTLHLYIVERLLAAFFDHDASSDFGDASADDDGVLMKKKRTLPGRNDFIQEIFIASQALSPVVGVDADHPIAPEPLSAPGKTVDPVVLVKTFDGYGTRYSGLSPPSPSLLIVPDIAL